MLTAQKYVYRSGIQAMATIKSIEFYEIYIFQPFLTTTLNLAFSENVVFKNSYRSRNSININS